MKSSRPTTATGLTAQPSFFWLHLSWIVIAFVIVLNILCIYGANSDRSWGALAIGLFYAPIGNAVILLSGLVAVIVARVRRVNQPFLRNLLTALLCPIIAAAITLVLIWNMDLHGC